MSVNKFQPHVFVLPEDDADRELALGFLQDPSLLTSKIRLLPVAGGWIEVLERFKSDHIIEMKRYPQRFMVLLIDFDQQEDRLDRAKEVVPDDLKERVFVLGVWGEPEDLRKAGLGSLETVGKALAKDCREDTDMTWGHDLLKHNTGELERLRERVRPILF